MNSVIIDRKIRTKTFHINDIKEMIRNTGGIGEFDRKLKGKLQALVDSYLEGNSRLNNRSA